MSRHASLNRIYRLVWSMVCNAWVAVAEITRGRSKGGARRKLIAATLALTSTLAQAAPTGGQVVGGTGSISQSGNTTTIQQNSQNLSVNWQSFNVASQESVNFVQPSAAAIAVNRIYDTAGSQILGKLTANGQVWLINPNGILFGQGAQVNVGGLVASTLDLAASDGKTARFSGTSSASVINAGSLNASSGGYIALLGKNVSNAGTISTPQGTVALGAGSTVTLNFNGNSLASLQVEQSLLDTLAANGGLIQADGGQVLLSAGARDSLIASVVNNTGVIEAKTVENRDGNIVLLAGMAAGTTKVGGTLDASAPTGGKGGFIETSGAKVKIADDAKITTLAANGQTGTWLIDPTDFTVAASGGDMTGAAVTSALASNNFTIQSSNGASGTAGNVNINDSVSWSAHTLTLNAANNITINAALNGSSTAGLALQYGQGAVAAGNTSIYTVSAPVNLAATGSFSTQQGSDGAVRNYTILTSLGAAGSSTATDLQGINGNLGGNYVLGADIDASTTSNWNGGQGFAPIGSNASYSAATQFTGTFDGLGHTVNKLFINRPLTDNVGLFGGAGTGATIRNLGLVGGSIGGKDRVGGLVGFNFQGTISNAYATGSVSGHGDVGGLIGLNYGTLSNAYATGSVTGSSKNVGGLVGTSTSIGTISDAYATGSVTGGASSLYVGGLVGWSSVTISNAYATGSVTGGASSYYVGGLVGENAGTLSNAYATGSVTGNNTVGGLVGRNYRKISNAYATGSVTGNKYVGGLVGINSISVATAIYGTISNAYWDTTTSGTSTGVGYNAATATLTNVVGKTSAEMRTFSTFSAWGADIGDTGGSGTIWRIYDGYTNPLLRSFLTPLTVSASSGSRIYDGTTTGLGVLSYSTAPNANLLGTATTTTSSKNVGTYTVTLGGLYSNQQGYDISYAGGTLSITPKAITGSITATGKTYDGTTAATTAGSLTGVITGDAVTLTNAGSFADKNAGIAKTVNVTGSLAGLDAGNYTVSTNARATASITPATLVYTAMPTSSYVGLPLEGLLSGTLSGFVVGDTLSNATTGSARWTSTASTTQSPGQYAITGSGLVATNYVFTQAAGNATALTLQAGGMPTVLVPITTQLVSELFNSPGSMSVTAPGASQTLPGNLIVWANGTSAPAGSGSSLAQTEAATPPAVAQDSSRAVSQGMALRIEDGGVRLPDARLRLN